MISGVPKRSVLGPTLFLVYINDLPEELSSQVRLLADGTVIYLTVGGSDDGTVLQTEIDRLSVWESRWDMEFYPSKCQVVRVTTAQEVSNTVYTLHGQILEVVTIAMYLGGWTSLAAYPGIPHRQNYWKCKSNFRIHPEKHQNKKTRR